MLFATFSSKHILLTNCSVFKHASSNWLTHLPHLSYMCLKILPALSFWTLSEKPRALMYSKVYSKVLCIFVLYCTTFTPHWVSGEQYRRKLGPKYIYISICVLKLSNTRLYSPLMEKMAEPFRKMKQNYCLTKKSARWIQLWKHMFI